MELYECVRDHALLLPNYCSVPQTAHPSLWSCFSHSHLLLKERCQLWLLPAAFLSLVFGRSVRSRLHLRSELTNICAQIHSALCNFVLFPNLSRLTHTVDVLWTIWTRVWSEPRIRKLAPANFAQLSVIWELDRRVLRGFYVRGKYFGKLSILSPGNILPSYSDVSNF